MGLFKSIGKIFNSIQGNTSAASLNNKYALQQMAANNAYQKEFAQNAHQWEVEDLKKAGLNPILSNGGSGAAASGGGGATGAGATGGGTIGGITDMFNSAADMARTISEIKKQKAETENTEVDTAGKAIENGFIKGKREAEINHLISNRVLNSAKTNTEKAQAKYTNERARGFSETTSWNGKLGGSTTWKGASGEASGGYTKSKTW